MQSSTRDQNACQLVIFDGKYSCDLLQKIHPIDNFFLIIIFFFTFGEQKEAFVVVHALYFLEYAF